MKKAHYDEMVNCINRLFPEGNYADKDVYVFAHCEASLSLVEELLLRGIMPRKILDNNSEKWGMNYKGILVSKPEEILDDNSTKSIVLIANRFFESMRAQLLSMGFVGEIEKVIDYNTYSDYSLSDETISKKQERVKIGKNAIDELREICAEEFLIFCPFSALGDIYLCMSYVKAFMENRCLNSAMICVSSRACEKVAGLFDNTNICVKLFSQTLLDSMVQASLFYRDERSFIAHQDRPYVINLHKALRLKCIPLEHIYRCGVFGLDDSTKPSVPTNWKEYDNSIVIPKSKSVILSPYAKSVTALPNGLWEKIAEKYHKDGYMVFTNVVDDEQEIKGTLPISPDISEMKSVVERAGLFIGIRSGLCDVLRTADCKKVAVYPDYFYSDTKWKAIDMYRLDEYENIVFNGNYSEVLNRV